VEEVLQSGELARLAGVSSDTLRHYERLGLLPKPPRTAGGYRDYPSHTLERVRLIRRALSVGFSLPELTTILKIRDQGGVPCHRVRVIAESKLTQVKEKIRELGVMRRQLEQILEKWDVKLARVRDGEQARLLETLADQQMPVPAPAASNKKNGKGGRI
jgi:DNA-binding transcriptional MerR regulator